MKGPHTIGWFGLQTTTSQLPEDDTTMVIFKKRQHAQAFCNSANQFPWFRVMVQSVPGGWTITRAKGVNNSITNKAM